jgi:hypothetical protein
MKNIRLTPWCLCQVSEVSATRACRTRMCTSRRGDTTIIGNIRNHSGTRLGFGLVLRKPRIKHERRSLRLLNRRQRCYLGSRCAKQSERVVSPANPRLRSQTLPRSKRPATPGGIPLLRLGNELQSGGGKLMCLFQKLMVITDILLLVTPLASLGQECS